MRERLLLMRRLRDSLGRGSRALVALDLIGMERETREQAEILKIISKSVVEAPQGNHSLNRSAGPVCDLSDELSKTENAVRQGLQLHAALLRRSQHKLRVMANMLADPALNYPSPFAPGGRFSPPFSTEPGGDRVDVCRA